MLVNDHVATQEIKAGGKQQAALAATIRQPEIRLTLCDFPLERTAELAWGELRINPAH